MLMQRLTETLARLRSWIAGRVRALSRAERREVVAAAPRESRVNLQQPRSWLDDAHRLRPRRSPAATTEQIHGKPAPRREMRPGVPTRPIVPPTAPRSQQPSPVRPRQLPAHPALPAPTPAPASTPAPIPPAVPQPAAANTPDDDAAQTRRQLLSLRYLVRLGLYNEGFAPDEVPEQYHRSLGMSDEP
jgi:hypothetical protein